MAKGMLDSMELRHGVKPLAKRGAPVQTKSTHIKSFDAPIDMTGDVMGKRATSKVNKKFGDFKPDPSGIGFEGGWGAATPGGFNGPNGPSNKPFKRPPEYDMPSRTPNMVDALAETRVPASSAPKMEAVSRRFDEPSAPVSKPSTPSSKPSVPNFTPQRVKPASSRIKDVPMPKKPAATSKVAKATRNEVHPLQSDNNPVGRGGSGGRGPQFSPYRSYTKDITAAGFVPSIGVGSGKKKDLQAPAKNLMPPYGSPAQKSSSAPMKKDITAAGFVPSIGVGSGKKKNDGMPSTFVIDHKKKK
jgi:hypothetical protein